ncbi:adenylosuccinate lyase [Ascidiimonas sp. W6]|uniref:adenylosuccinate lyase n=1 Tax=Ascidiimonas meishanensis TaxID=3128903 RepID=UPI0030EBEE7E
MTANLFFEELKTLKAYRETRKRLSNQVLKDPSLLPELLRICFLFDDPVSSRACWVLEFVCQEKLELLIPYLNNFTAQLRNFRLDSSKRPIAKVCQLLILAYFGKKPSVFKQELTELYLERITEATFDWLINDEKVAAKAYSIYTLFELGKKYSWIYPELQLVLRKDIPEQSAGYKAAAKKILSRLPKE